MKRPKNRPESKMFNENECNRRRKTRGIQKKYQTCPKTPKNTHTKNNKIIK